MSATTCDLLISGGGIAGLAAAAAFGSAGFHVICVDPTPPVTDREDDGADMRTTAMLQPARDVLERAGLWERLEPHATPLQIMRIVDAGGPDPEARLTKDFNASDISDLPFGWNLPNWLLRREMVARLAELPNVDFRPGMATSSLFTREGEARVVLSDGSRVTTRLVVAADGRNSPMRQAAGIGVSTKRYGQKALAFAVTHPIPHDNVSTEIHRTGGPFTLVPLPDLDGVPSSAVVWMDDGPLAQQRMALEVAAFEEEMSQRSCYLFGPLTLASRRSIWPIISQKADRLSGERIALIAEAAIDIGVTALAAGSQSYSATIASSEVDRDESNNSATGTVTVSATSSSGSDSDSGGGAVNLIWLLLLAAGRLQRRRIPG